MKKFEIVFHSDSRLKLALCLSAIGIVLGLFGLLMLAFDWIDTALSDPGMNISSLFPYYDNTITILFVIQYVSLILLCVVLLYNYMVKKKLPEQSEEIGSVLREDAAKHEKQLTELLISLAQPAPGKKKLNRARVAQYLRAMMELNLIDPNTSGKRLMLWVESVTGLKDGEAGHFQQAIKNATPQDSYVVELRKQIEQIIAQPDYQTK